MRGFFQTEKIPWRGAQRETQTGAKPELEAGAEVETLTMSVGVGEVGVLRLQAERKWTAATEQGWLQAGGTAALPLSASLYSSAARARFSLSLHVHAHRHKWMADSAPCEVAPKLLLVLKCGLVYIEKVRD